MEHDFGVRRLPLKLFTSYLSTRYQYTKINNNKSSLSKVSCEVSQGSSLKPLLFLLLPQVIRFDTTLFADDTLLMLSDKNLNKSEYKADNELSKIDYWLKKQAIAKLH